MREGSSPILIPKAVEALPFANHCLASGWGRSVYLAGDATRPTLLQVSSRVCNPTCALSIFVDLAATGYPREGLFGVVTNTWESIADRPRVLNMFSEKSNDKAMSAGVCWRYRQVCSRRRDRVGARKIMALSLPADAIPAQ